MVRSKTNFRNVVNNVNSVNVIKNTKKNGKNRKNRKANTILNRKNKVFKTKHLYGKIK